MSVTLTIKLASIAVHLDEMLSADGHDFDRLTIRSLLDDAEVSAWLDRIDPVLLPVKRRHT